jgi:hypothetical protein
MKMESRSAIWTGRILGGLAVVFLFLDALGKLLRLTPVIEGTTRFGYSETVIVPLGIVLAACTAAYAIPRLSVLGAILLTGYLGGAVATHVRAGDSVFPIVFPVIMGTLLWVGLWLRDKRLRTLLPLKNPQHG